MGMGEPLNNFESVRTAVEQLTSPQGFALSRRNVCVSTVGPSPAMIRQAGQLPCRLAWSVHAVDDELRRLLVPTTRQPMEELRGAFQATLATKPGGDKARGLLVELALMGGVNDRPEHAEQLASFLVRTHARAPILEWRRRRTEWLALPSLPCARTPPPCARTTLLALALPSSRSQARTVRAPLIPLTCVSPSDSSDVREPL